MLSTTMMLGMTPEQKGPEKDRPTSNSHTALQTDKRQVELALVLPANQSEDSQAAAQ